MAKNEVYVTTDLTDTKLWNDRIKLADVHWIEQPPVNGKAVQVRTRHRAQLIDGVLTHETGEYQLTLKSEVRALSPGQSAVVYSGRAVLGGGIIV